MIDVPALLHGAKGFVGLLGPRRVQLGPAPHRRERGGLVHLRAALAEPAARPVPEGVEAVAPTA